MKIMYKFLSILFTLMALVYLGCEDYTEDFPVPDPSTVARFEIVPQNNFVAPDVIMFRNTSSVPERAGDPTFYWDFGDGVTYETTSFDSIYHSYENIGTYNVSLTVKTSAGDSSFTSEKIELIDILLGDTLLFEDFETSGLFPENWVLENVDGKTPASGVGLPALADSAWVVRYSGLMGSNVAIGTSWYEESPSAADDWFILPKITLGPNAALQWQGMSFTSSGDYPDDYEIYISTSTQDSEGCLANDRLLRVDNEAWRESVGGEGPQRRRLFFKDLGYQNVDVYIGFRLMTPHPGGSTLGIDDILVIELD
ncbi:MAG: choice-of-anchor J domain-containing protein [Bacteroidales bacterium]